MGIKVDISRTIDMREINFSNLLYGTPTTATPSTYVLKYFGGYSDVFEGHGFKYDKNGIPTGGTAKSLTELHGNDVLFSISGASLSVKAIISAAMTATSYDDQNIIRKALRGDDVIDGSQGNDVLFGEAGRDKIDGNGGRDTILSGVGADRMSGGGGGDVFLYVSRSHSGPERSSQDTILDFSHQDRIDLSDIGNFNFVGSSGFSGGGDEICFVKSHGDTTVFADTNGDKKADFSIHLDDFTSLVRADFIL